MAVEMTHAFIFTFILHFLLLFTSAKRYVICSGSVHYYDCSHAIVITLIPDIIRLNFSHNQFMVIQPYLLSQQGLLEELYFSFSHVVIVQNNSFRNNTQLRLLDLSGNKLKRIGSTAFSPLQNLQTLKIHDQAQSGKKIYKPKVDLSDITMVSELSIMMYHVDNFTVLNHLPLQVLTVDMGFEYEQLPVDVLSLTSLQHLKVIKFQFLDLSWPDREGGRMEKSLTLEVVVNPERIRNGTWIKFNNIRFWQLLVSGSVRNLAEFNHFLQDLSTVTGMRIVIDVSVQEMDHNQIIFDTCPPTSSHKGLNDVTLDGNTTSILYNFLHYGRKYDLEVGSLIVHGFNVHMLACDALLQFGGLVELGLLGGTIMKLTHCNCSRVMKFLKTIRINHHQLTTWQRFANFPALETLDLNNNQITLVLSCDAVPEGFEMLKNLHLAHNPLLTLQPCFPQNLHFLDLSYTELQTIPPWFAAYFPKLVVLRLEGNGLVEIAFTGMMLKELYLSNNLISKLKWPSFPHDLVSLDLSNNNLSVIPKNTLPTTLSFLNISSNKLATLGSDTLPSSITALDLSLNQLHAVDSGALPLSLLFLNISRNKIFAFDETWLGGLNYLKEFDAQGNPFDCSCTLEWFVEDFIGQGEKHINDANQHVCVFPARWAKTPIVSCTWSYMECNIWLQAMIGLVLALILIVVLGALFVYCQGPWYMRMFWYWVLFKHRRHATQPTGYLYDAFVSCGDDDEEWTIGLVKRLEEDGYTICFPDRDFMPGKAIVDNIIDGMERSYKTVFVITDNFINTDWCHYELYFAQQNVMQILEDNLILVIVGELGENSIPSQFCRLRRIVNQKTYLKFPQEKVKQEVFWRNLIAALGSTNEKLLADSLQLPVLSPPENVDQCKAQRFIDEHVLPKPLAIAAKMIVENFLPSRSGPAMLNTAVIFTICCTYLAWTSNTACLTSCTYDTGQRECSTRWDSSDQLDLSSCGLHSVCQAFFVDHEHISILDLSENHLCYFEASCFSNLNALQILKLHGQVLDNTVHGPTVNFSDLQHLKELSIMSYHVGNLNDLSHLRLHTLTVEMAPGCEILQQDFLSIKTLKHLRITNVGQLIILPPTRQVIFSYRLNLLELFFNPLISSNTSLNIAGHLFVKQLRLSGKVELWKDLESLLLSVKNDPSIEIIINVEVMEVQKRTVFRPCVPPFGHKDGLTVSIERNTEHIFYFLGELAKAQNIIVHKLTLNNMNTDELDCGMIEHLPDLHELHIRGGQVKSVTHCNCAVHLTKLRHIQLTHLYLTLWQYFGDLVALQSLKERHNNIQANRRCYYMEGMYDTLEELDISNNPLKELKPCFPQHLRKFDLSYTQLSTIPDWFPGHFVNLSILGLEGNRLTTIQLHNMSLRELDVSHNHISSLDPFSLPQGLVQLDLSYNSITTLGTHVFPISLSNVNFSLNTLSLLNQNTLPPNIDILDLSQNKLYYISAGALPPNLMFLNISRNNLKGLEKDWLEGLLALKLLDAQHNPFFCTCGLRWFVQDFSRRSELNISHVENYLCIYPSRWEGTPILTYTLDDIQCSHGIQAAIGLASVAVVLVILITVFIKCHGPWYMRMGWYWIRLKGKSHFDSETDFLYDVFVSYSEKDAAWSYDLIQKLEAEGLRVCCHERDFLPGRPIMDNIMESIEGSRRAVFLLSENFVASAWCHYEFYFAQQRLMQSAEDRLILVLLHKLQHDSIPRRFVRLKQLLGRKCLLEFPKEPEKQETFWNDLRAALQHPLNEPDAGKH
uniref:uncharacterized protein n=1 Tax=Myxine glutinosa TaxID=7769 RepID=UPI00358FEDA6